MNFLFAELIDNFFDLNLLLNPIKPLLIFFRYNQVLHLIYHQQTVHIQFWKFQRIQLCEN